MENPRTGVVMTEIPFQPVDEAALQDIARTLNIGVEISMLPDEAGPAIELPPTSPVMVLPPVPQFHATIHHPELTLPAPVAAEQSSVPEPETGQKAHASPVGHVTNIKMPQSRLNAFPESVFRSGHQLHFLNLCRNQISRIPPEIGDFSSLVELNLGRNRIETVPEEVTRLVSLVRLDLSGNRIHKLPPNFRRLQVLQQLQLNGNQFHEIPEDIFHMPVMLKLYVGNNRITQLSPHIARLRNLEVLYLGGNLLSTIPSELGSLHNLALLYLGDNQLATLPQSIGNLKLLRTLNLHNNRFEYLPIEIMRMRNLENLSLRGNPLIVDFVNTPIYEPLSLKELAGRAIKNLGIPIDRSKLPPELASYINGARRCNNPKCAGVYFQSSVKNLEVVDFCGKFRVPLLKFLCQEKCTGDGAAFPTCSKSSARLRQPCQKKMKRVLLDDYEHECDCSACTN